MIYSCKWRVETIISVLAFAISLAAFMVVLFGVPGVTRPIKPSGYAILRGVDAFPSDHIVLPLEWENSSGHSVHISNLYLRLCKLDSMNHETQTEYIFFLAGSYDSISTGSFQKEYEIISSFVLEPRTISTRLLVFHISKWWEDKDPLFRFRFFASERYRVYVDYQQDLSWKPEKVLFVMPIFDSAKRLEADKRQWDFWYIDLGTRPSNLILKNLEKLFRTLVKFVLKGRLL